MSAGALDLPRALRRRTRLFLSRERARRGTANAPAGSEALQETTVDVRGAAPDAQAAWTLAALESLPDGQTLVHLNSEVPWFLLSHLETRGYRYRIRAAEAGAVRIEIRRLARPTGSWPREPRHWTLRPCGCATVEGGTA